MLKAEDFIVLERETKHRQVPGPRVRAASNLRWGVRRLRVQVSKFAERFVPSMPADEGYRTLEAFATLELLHDQMQKLVRNLGQYPEPKPKRGRPPNAERPKVTKRTRVQLLDHLDRARAKRKTDAFRVAADKSWAARQAKKNQ